MRIVKVSIFLIPIFLIFGYWASSTPVLTTRINGYEIAPFAVLAEADLEGTILKGADLHGVVLNNANLKNSMLADSDLSGANSSLPILREQTLRARTCEAQI